MLLCWQNTLKKQQSGAGNKSIPGDYNRFRMSLGLPADNLSYIKAVLLSKVTLAPGNFATYRTSSHIPETRREVKANAVVSNYMGISSTEMSSLMSETKNPQVTFTRSGQHEAVS